MRRVCVDLLRRCVHAGRADGVFPAARIPNTSNTCLFTAKTDATQPFDPYDEALWTTAGLRTELKALGVKGFSSLRKAELAQKLKETLADVQQQTKTSTTTGRGALPLLAEFNPSLPIEEASTPPVSWYTNDSFHRAEMERIFHRHWIQVGNVQQVEEVGVSGLLVSFVSGTTVRKRWGRLILLVCLFGKP